MASAPLVITWPGGIGNPIGEQIPVSGGRRRRTNRKTRKNRRSTRKGHRKGQRKATRRRRA